MANDDCIKVLMLGAKRAGKTTLLASLVEAVMTGPLRDTICVRDVTSYAEGESTLHDKLENLRGFISSRRNRQITLDTDATNGFRDYTLSVTVPGARGETRVMFTDSNGEFYAAGSQASAELTEKIASYDILVVAIDATYLMESANGGSELCTPVVNKMFNQVPNSQTLLSCVDDLEGKVARQVIFVPIKAERWLHEGRRGELINRVKEVYAVPLKSLEAYKNVEIGIMPVETVGALTFAAHREAMLLTRGAATIKCSPVGQRMLCADGSMVVPLPTDVVNRDPRAMIGSIACPYSWFDTNDGAYEPVDCGALAYHVMRFALSKTVAAKKAENSGSFSLKKALVVAAMVATGLYAFAAAVAAYSFLKKRLGSIDIKALSKALDDIRDYYGDRGGVGHIEIIKRGLTDSI